MPIFPAPLALPAQVGQISSYGPNSLGAVFLAVQASALASATWSSANRALYSPFRLGCTINVTDMFVANGSTASGNLDLGIYDERGTRLVSSGSTAQSGTSVI